MKNETLYSNITMVFNSLRTHKIRFNVLDETYKIRIELIDEHDEYYDNFTVSDNIYVPIVPQSESFVLIDHDNAFHEWINNVAKLINN